jgi:hypothetical protein
MKYKAKLIFKDKDDNSFALLNIVVKASSKAKAITLLTLLLKHDGIYDNIIIRTIKKMRY